MAFGRPLIWNEDISRLAWFGYPPPLPIAIATAGAPEGTLNLVAAEEQAEEEQAGMGMGMAGNGMGMGMGMGGMGGMGMGGQQMLNNEMGQQMMNATPNPMISLPPAIAPSVATTAYYGGYQGNPHPQLTQAQVPQAHVQQMTSATNPPVAITEIYPKSTRSRDRSRSVDRSGREGHRDRRSSRDSRGHRYGHGHGDRHRSSSSRRD